MGGGVGVGIGIVIIVRVRIQGGPWLDFGAREQDQDKVVAGMGPLPKGRERSEPWQGPGRSGRGRSMSPLTPRMRVQLMEPYPKCLGSSSVLKAGGLCNKAAA